MRTEWNLSLLYDSLTDSRIEADVARTERDYKAFARTYNKQDAPWLVQAQALVKALTAYERLSVLPGERAVLYAHYLRELDATRTDADALLMRLDERLTKVGTLVMFFENRLAKIPKAQQRIFLKDARLQKYHYFLTRLFLSGKHILDEKEERILALTSNPRSSLWVSGVDKMLNKLTVRIQGKTMPFNEAITKAPVRKSAKERHNWHQALMYALKEAGDFPESEMNAVFTNKKTSDELRGYTSAYDATIMHYENDARSVLALVAAVTKHFAIAHEFYALKSEMMGETLAYADRSAPVGDTKKKIPFTDAVQIVGDAFRRLLPRYGEILTAFLAQGHIDAYPRLGKAGGAYCSGSVAAPTYVLLNHTDDLRSLYTLAHEMGHAIHTERSKEQGVVYQGYSTAVAETASTFFERVVFYDVFKTLSKEEQIIALHNKIQDDIATVFRQIAFFNFELALHSKVRTEGWVSKEEMARLLSTHLKSYLGPAVAVDEMDGYSFIYIGHFRRPFYVYSYAYGQLISNALYEKYREDPAYIEKIDAFLRAGGSATPERIFKNIGIDVTNPDFWESGLKTIKRDIQTLKKLIRK